MFWCQLVIFSPADPTKCSNQPYFFKQTKKRQRELLVGHPKNEASSPWEQRKRKSYRIKLINIPPHKGKSKLNAGKYFCTFFFLNWRVKRRDSPLKVKNDSNGKNGVAWKQKNKKHFNIRSRRPWQNMLHKISSARLKTGHSKTLRRCPRDTSKHDVQKPVFKRNFSRYACQIVWIVMPRTKATKTAVKLCFSCITVIFLFFFFLRLSISEIWRPRASQSQRLEFVCSYESKST